MLVVCHFLPVCCMLIRFSSGPGSILGSFQSVGTQRTDGQIPFTQRVYVRIRDRSCTMHRPLTSRRCHFLSALHHAAGRLDLMAICLGRSASETKAEVSRAPVCDSQRFPEWADSTDSLCDRGAESCIRPRSSPRLRGMVRNLSALMRLALLCIYSWDVE